MGYSPAPPPLVSNHSQVSSCSSSTSSTPSEIDIDDLDHRFRQCTLANASAQVPEDPALRSTQQVDDIESFRMQLYLSLIPAGLLPKDAFTVDPRTGVTVLQKPTISTLLFLRKLEALWQAANFAEDIALYYMESAVSTRSKSRSADAGALELTTEDLERAIVKMQSEAFDRPARSEGKS